MTTTTERKVTERLAQATLEAVRKRFAPWIAAGYEGPMLKMDWDWPGKPTPAIIWEGGPFEWAYLDLGGDVEEEFGSKVPAMAVPRGVRAEPWNGHVLCLYRED